MPISSPGVLATLALAFTSVAAVPAAFAQMQPPAQSTQDHEAHHPGGQAPGTQAPATQPPKGGPAGMMGQGGMMGGMMCGDMKQMMSMMQDMHAMMRMHTGMMGSRLEGDIAKLKTDLKITDAQVPQWDRFADTVRRVAKAMDETHQHMMMAETTLPARLARSEKAMQANLDAMKALEEALQPLYAALSEEQKKIADKIRLGPMGMM